MSKILPANRVAAISAFLTGLAAAVLAITNTFPHNWQQTTIAIAGILGATGTALHFMLGSQKYDKNVSDQIVADKQAQIAQAYNASVSSNGLIQPPYDQNSVTDVTGVTDDQPPIIDLGNTDPNYHPESSLAPEPDDGGTPDTGPAIQKTDDPAVTTGETA